MQILTIVSFQIRFMERFEFVNHQVLHNSFPTNFSPTFHCFAKIYWSQPVQNTTCYKWNSVLLELFEFIDRKKFYTTAFNLNDCNYFVIQNFIFLSSLNTELTINTYNIFIISFCKHNFRYWELGTPFCLCIVAPSCTRYI